MAQNLFLSTLSLRRATATGGESAHTLTHFYPRSPYGERRHALAELDLLGHFYPRSPYGERPFFSSFKQLSAQYFYPRSPYGERPAVLYRILQM